MTELPVALDVDDRAAPPRSNGTLAFAAPWERRLFGVTMALHEAGHFEWEDFRQRLIGSIARWEASHPGGEEYRYYEQWLAALQSLVDEVGLVGVGELDTRLVELAARPAGHDHQHGGHDHDR